MRQIGGEIIGDPVGEIVLLLVAAQVLERQHDNGELRRVRELVLRDGSAEQSRREARMPGVSAGGKNEQQRARRRTWSNASSSRFFPARACPSFA